MIEVNNRVLNKDVYSILLDVKANLTNGMLSRIEYSGQKDIRISCPFHSFGLEKRPSCFVRVEDGVFHCFVDGESGPFEKLVAKCFDSSIDYAAKWLISHYANDYVKKELNLKPIITDTVEDTVNTYLDESILDTFEDYHPYMTQRKLTEDIIKRFKIKYDPLTKCIVSPVRDRKGNLKYLTRRSVLSKKFIIDKAANKRDIYLLDEAIKNRYREVIVCESQFNALTCYEYGYNGIALLGCGTTYEQMQELNNTDIRHFILMYDNDKAGREGAEKFKKFVNKNKFVTDIVMPKDRDVNDLSKEEFLNILKENGVINENS